MCLYGPASALGTPGTSQAASGAGAPAGSVAGSSSHGLQWSRESSLVTELNQE